MPAVFLPVVCLPSPLSATPRLRPPSPPRARKSPLPQSYGKLLGMMEQEFVERRRSHARRQVQFRARRTGEFKGVRTFAGQVKHVTGSSYYFFGGPDLSQADVKAKEDAVEKLTTKAEIVQALKDSFIKAHAFVDGITPENAFVTMPNGNTRGGLAAFRLGTHDGPLRPAGRLPAHEWDRAPGQPRFDVAVEVGVIFSVSVSLSEIPNSV